MEPIRRASSKSTRNSLYFVLILSVFALVGCSTGVTAELTIPVTIHVDGQQNTVQVPAGSTVQFALDQAQITLSNLDQVDPPTYTLLTAQAEVTITRIEEVFEIEEKTIPFQSQTVLNESLPEGQRRLIQQGVTGLQQITYRRVIEDKIEQSRTVFKTTVITESRPEIVMVGVQTPFTPVAINGTLAYLTAGNAWVMVNTSGERKPVITSGDLDGRVFTLSPDGQWLLFTRKNTDPSTTDINSLWVVDVTAETPDPVDLEVKNIIHFADWIPDSGLQIAYSSVEPRDAAPGWQANNDLHFLTMGSIGGVVRDTEIIAPNSGGIYGWWGTNFSFSPDGSQVAYARPDGVGLVDTENGQFQPLLDLIPLQTRGDWAWVPGLAWSPQYNLLYTVTHVALAGLTTSEASPLFDLIGIDTANAQGIDLIPQTGMFAYPTVSPVLPGNRFMLASLQAVFPDQSETSRYRLMLMDRDGSNRRAIFPPEGSPGLEPQKVIWSQLVPETGEIWLAAIYQGNIYLINVQTGKWQQITGDGSIGKLDWK